MPYTYNREELAWSAGLFDGEGSVHNTYGWQRKSGESRHTIQVTIGQSDGERGQEVLERFNQATGNMGKIYGPYPSKLEGRSPISQFEVNGFAKVQMIFVLLYPWLGSVKREKFIKTLKEHIEERKVK